MLSSLRKCTTIGVSICIVDSSSYSRKKNSRNTRTTASIILCPASNWPNWKITSPIKTSSKWVHSSLTCSSMNIRRSPLFQTCRLQANMIELKLDGFLLSPIQRICQYPLQLNELLKYTNTEHKDYENIQQALHTMRDVASFINERKRRMEFVEVIHKWQSTVEHWQVRRVGRMNGWVVEFKRERNVPSGKTRRFRLFSRIERRRITDCIREQCRMKLILISRERI